MHVVHVMAVFGENQSGAERNLTNYLGDSVEGTTWWDWYQVGGRWNGYFGSYSDEIPSLAGYTANVLSVRDYPMETDLILESLVKKQNSVFLEQRDKFSGATVYESGEVDGHVFGLPVAASVEAAQRRTKHNKEMYEEWQRVLKAESLAELDGHMLMSAYYMRILLNIVEGNWCADSFFWDAAYQTSSAKGFLEALHDGRQSRESEGNVYLIAVDFHF